MKLTRRNFLKQVSLVAGLAGLGFKVAKAEKPTKSKSQYPISVEAMGSSTAILNYVSGTGIRQGQVIHIGSDGKIYPTTGSSGAPLGTSLRNVGAGEVVDFSRLLFSDWYRPIYPD
jgi:hypothetical protein